MPQPTDDPAFVSHIAWCHRMREAAIDAVEQTINGGRTIMMVGDDQKFDLTDGDEAQQRGIYEHLTAFLLSQGEDLTGRGTISPARLAPMAAGFPGGWTRVVGEVVEDGVVRPPPRR